jgi:peptidoglycan/LPS O-acetylase OafA/YrhL
MRGYAALAVVIYHSILYWFGEQTNPLIVTSIFDVNGWYAKTAKALITVFDGQTAVFFFFVISGAVLFQSLKRQEGWWPIVAGRFAVARALRIYPALVVCLLVFWAISAGLSHFWPKIGGPELGPILRNAALIDTTVHGATWTLKAEMVAIPLILGAFFIARRLGVGALAVLACLSILAFDPGGLKSVVYLSSMWSLYFIAGFIASEIADSRLVHELTRNGRWALLMVGALVIRGVYPLGPLAGTIVQCFCICILVAHALSRASTSALKRFADLPVSQFLGKISYSLYLWNVPVMIILTRCMDQSWSMAHPIEAGLIVAFSVSAITLPIAWLSARYLENFRPPALALRSGRILPE